MADQDVDVTAAGEELHVVGIGASAGGLEALKLLVANLPADSNFAYIVAQHLAPQHVSLLSQLLGREAPIPVLEAQEGAEIQANHIYITPPNADLVVRKRRLQLCAPSLRGPKPSIDLLFLSLAEEFGQHAIGIILSGTGSDGAHGVQAIKGTDGFVMAQDKETAKYFSMPQSAIQTKCVDLVLPPSQMGQELLNLANHRVKLLLGDPQVEPSGSIENLLDTLRQQTGIDFSGYKPGTITRRVANRMAACRMSNLRDYARLVSTDKAEAERLVKTILISVTSFFRDREAFAVLKAKLAERLQDGQFLGGIRAWVPGCATGEEVYSIAILLAELAPDRRIQVFGTDINGDAIAFARKGNYSEAALRGVPPDILDRYFRDTGAELQVVKTIRERVVFAQHNLTKDPPFLNLDLISCRNVLIYFQPELQSQVLQMFHQSLRHGGLLMLGKSETVAQAVEYFSEADRRHRIYRQRAVPLVENKPVAPRLVWSGMREPGSERVARPRPGGDDMIRAALLKQFAPTAVLLDNGLNLVESYGDVSRYLSLAPGKADLRVINLLPQALRAPLRAQIFRARKDRKPDLGVSRPVVLQGESCDVRMSVYPVAEANSEDPFFLVTFQEAPSASPHPSSEAEAERRSSDSKTIAELEDELSAVRESLQTVIEELETSNEELQSLNEELQSSNEELQASNEELEASNEELQATNEELITVNEELAQRSAELGSTIGDLENIQNSLAFPLLVVDKQLQVRRFNRRSAEVFSLTAADIGKPLSSLEGQSGLAGLVPKVRSVLRRGKNSMRQVKLNGRQVRLNIQPYLGEEESPAGAVLSFVDVSDLLRMQAEIQRQESERKRLISLQQGILDGIAGHVALLDAHGVIVAVNAAWRQFGQQNDLLMKDAGVGANYLEVCRRAAGQNADARRALEGIQSVLEGRSKEFVIEYACHRGDEERWFRALVSPTTVQGAHGAVVLHVNITADVVANRVMMLQAAALRTVADAILITNRDGAIEWVNEAFVRLSGFSLQEAAGRNPAFLSSSEHSRQFWEEVWEVVRHGSSWRGEVTNHDRDGRAFTVKQTITPIVDANGRTTHFVVAWQDISSRKEAQHLILHMAQHDELTGLPNRNRFHQRLAQAVEWAGRRGRKLAVIFLDLDRFKDINDTLGHQVGDQLLVAVARRLENRLHGMHVLARLGGDEFAVLVEDVASRESAAAIAERLLGCFVDPIPVDGHAIAITASLGIALHESRKSSPESLMRAADLAMYQVKASGRNNFQFYDDELGERIIERVDLARQLRDALAANDLWLAFQPQIDLAGGSTVCLEALLRWTHPRFGAVPPQKIISVAEESGAMPQVSDWVLSEVCALHKNWRRDGLPLLPVAVNLSGVELDQENFGESLVARLHANGLEAGHLQVEITEGVLLHQNSRVRKSIGQLYKAGVKLVLDDFGTGYSSLTYLRQFPVSALKIDGSFIGGIGRHQSDEAIVRTIIDLAHSVGVQVVGEGVETREQSEFLTAAGCDLAQGFFYARPMPSPELMLYLRGAAAPGSVEFLRDAACGSHSG